MQNALKTYRPLETTRETRKLVEVNMALQTAMRPYASPKIVLELLFEIGSRGMNDLWRAFQRHIPGAPVCRMVEMSELHTPSSTAPEALLLI